MTDQGATVYAEALIMTVARAFYEDSVVCLIDVLIRDKFLRDDDMSKRLSLSAKQLRKTLHFLQSEHLVKSESVDDLDEDGSQTTIFWYIDYNHAVKVIMLRMYLLQKKLEEAEIRARSCSMYLCPGFETKVCNGRYTENDAQKVVDPETGLFLCQECALRHANNPDPPPKESYTLQLLDNTRDLKIAEENMRRVKVQLSRKMIGNQQLRNGIYDLIEKVRSKGAGPLTSNLPSENREMDIGTERLEGTGRTYNVKQKKRNEQQSKARANGSAALKLMNKNAADDLTFLKNAMGQQLTFKLDKGGGDRANLLATRGKRKRELLDAAAIRIGVELDLVSELALQHKRKKEEEAKQTESERQAKAKKNATLEFLKDNIGRTEEEGAEASNSKQPNNQDEQTDEVGDDEFGIAVDSDDEFADMSTDEKRVRFSAYYKREMLRQKALMQPQGVNNGLRQHHVVSDTGDEDDGEHVAWEEG